MRCCLLSLLLAALTVPVGPNREDPVKDDLAKLEGEWAVVSFEVDGMKYSDEELKNYPHLNMKGTQYRWSNDSSAGTMKIDPRRKPKAVDYVIGTGSQQGETQLGIYDIQGDTFRDCIAPAGRTRPLGFAAPAGSGYSLLVYKRVK